MEKLQTIADHYGIEVDKHEENKEHFDKLNKDLAQLDKQKKIVQSAIDTMSKKYESAVTEKKKEYDQLYMKKAMILRSYNEKIKLLRLKGQEIQDLIEKAKSGADKGLIEILAKWEEANMKIFEKYPEEGEAAEMSLLEQAATEIKKSEVVTESTPKPRNEEQSKKGQAASKKKKDDEDMRRYMEELKLKEVEMQQRVAEQADKNKREQEITMIMKKEQEDRDRVEAQKRIQDEERDRKIKLELEV